MRAGERLLAVMRGSTITPEHFRSDGQEETIILGRTKHDFWDEGEIIEYEDTETTRRYRDEMRRINEWLETADIECIDHDATRRRLRRSFTRGRFDSGGRLFGGFWQGLPRATRRECLVIDSEPPTELDYGQMGVRILYGLAGTPTPLNGDLYAIPGFERDREGIKKVMSAMIFANRPLEQKPKGTAKLFNPRIPFADIRDAILRHHAPIAHLFHTGIGHHAQFIESQIMVSVLLSLRELGVVALPIHDAIIVGERHADVAETVMLDAFTTVVGQQGIVSRD